MQDFDYLPATCAADVIGALSSGTDPVYVLSGGTDLLVQLREGRRKARLLVDIKAVPELNTLDCDPSEGLRFGAAVPCYRLCAHVAVTGTYPGLLDGVSLIGGVQIQGRATVGGNLCNASPAADSIPALIVHSAMCIIAGPEGQRQTRVEDFCVAPGRTVLGRGEFLNGFSVPAPVRDFGAAYLRFTPRNEMDIAVVGAGASVVLDEDGTHFLGARIALGAVAPVPLFVPEAGEWLAGRPVTHDSIAGAARIAQDAARPITDIRGTARQRAHLAGVLTERALTRAVARARGREEVQL